MVEREYGGYVYILGNWTGEVLYVGVTADLKRRIYEHRQRLCAGFTKAYNVDRVLYYEAHPDIASAIAREKRIKGGPRWRKEKLVRDFNPEWRDLYDLV